MFRNSSIIFIRTALTRDGSLCTTSVRPGGAFLFLVDAPFPSRYDTDQGPCCAHQKKVGIGPTAELPPPRTAPPLARRHHLRLRHRTSILPSLLPGAPSFALNAATEVVPPGALVLPPASRHQGPTPSRAGPPPCMPLPRGAWFCSPPAWRSPLHAAAKRKLTTLDFAWFGGVVAPCIAVC
jgi:hypothetical protein